VGGCRTLGEVLFEFLAWLEVRYALGWHINRLAGFGIPTSARASLASAEAAKAAQFNLFAFVQGADYRVEHCLDYYFGITLVQLSRSSHFLNKFCLSHLSPVSRSSSAAVFNSVIIPRGCGGMNRPTRSP
jgi:hypothetical protein